LHTSGKDVGLPDGQMGNSEVGHLNIGAGRVVMQDLPRINQAVDTGEIARAPALLGLIERLRSSGSTCHLMGLVSPGGVHSHQDHAAALAKVLAQAGVLTVLHVFTDGRDTPPQSAEGYVRRLASMLPSGVSIGTVSGRYYAMDRDNRWDRVSKAYHAIVDAEGPRFADAHAAIADAYAHDVTDEFVVPAVVGDYGGVRDGDGLLCFNFRADRVREILAALLDPAFSGFPRPRVALRCRHRHDAIQRALGQAAADDLSTAHTSERSRRGRRMQAARSCARPRPRSTRTSPTSLNGGNETQYAGEDRIMVPSPKVATYDLQPRDVSPRADDQGRRRHRLGQIRPHRPELRQSRHGRAHRQAGRRDQGG
jgi:2,3-bisphosphoglycerate-independent phosphoglycerate mutase